MDEQEALLAALKSELKEYEKQLKDLDNKDVRIQRDGEDIKEKLISELRASVAYRNKEVASIEAQITAKGRA